nr:immunoglobulin heavy chain junction region [Macaca mulatta]
CATSLPEWELYFEFW